MCMPAIRRQTRAFVKRQVAREFSHLSHAGLCIVGRNVLNPAAPSRGLPKVYRFGKNLVTFRVHELPPEDLHRLRAAEGWLELGDSPEANAELDNITPALRAHPAVLAVRWQIEAKAGRWDQAHEIARALTELVPEECSVWVWRAYAVRRMAGGGIEQARELLRGMVEKFPREWVLPYNLACYACQLGHVEQARDWLQKALALGNARALKLMALEDPDLEPLWKDLGKP